MLLCVRHKDESRASKRANISIAHVALSSFQCCATFFLACILGGRLAKDGELRVASVFYEHGRF